MSRQPMARYCEARLRPPSWNFPSYKLPYQPLTCLNTSQVILHTNFGDVDIELWSKECPKACRNFVQLCLEGYYDNTIFHRVIPKFMVQGGDPTGSGQGGESIYGKAFKDEPHQRIKFNHRGQVACANENVPNSNHSQFFFTMDKCEWIDKKHTIFGKITGNTIFNALRMGSVDTDANDRPIDPIRLESAEVLLNPFDDCVPRYTPASHLAQPSKADALTMKKEPEKKKKKKGKKDFKLLSFGEEAQEEEVAVEGMTGSKGVVSAHDALGSELLRKEKAYDLEVGVHPIRRRHTQRDNLLQSIKKRKRRIKGNRCSVKEITSQCCYRTASFYRFPPKKKAKVKAKADEEELDRDEEGDRKTGEKEKDQAQDEDKEEDDEGDAFMAKMQDVREKTQEFQRLRDELRAKHKAATAAANGEVVEPKPENDLLTPLQQMRASFKRKRKATGGREEDTLAKLAAFSKKIKEQKSRAPKEEKPKETEEYHGQVTEVGLYEGDSSGDEKDWFSGPLKFKKHIDDNFRMAADGRDASDYSVIDPLNPKKGQGQGSNTGRGGSGHREGRRDHGRDSGHRDYGGGRDRRDDRGGGRHRRDDGRHRRDDGRDRRDRERDRGGRREKW
ncbi:unnamed protein product [Chrysoparadoxa australica]